MENNQQFMSVTGQPLNLDVSEGFLGKCAAISSFEKLNQLGEGTYGVVHRARDTRNCQIIALKQLRIFPEERQNGIPITALREISILRSLRHANIVNVVDVAVGEKSLDEVYMVMEYAEQDLANLLDDIRVKFTLSQVKCLFRQLLEGLEYLHRNDIIHRDVKLQNILLTGKGVLKLADFGMAREYSPRPLTPGVVTIWYRSPELLLGTKNYTPSVDIWSAGLILAELLLSVPCLPGETAIEQLSLIVKLLGSPTADDIAALTEMGCPELIQWRRQTMAQGRVNNLERRFLTESTKETVTFLGGLLRWDPRARWTATEALSKGRSRFAAEAERWWREPPREADMELLPTFPEVRNQKVVEEIPYRGNTNNAQDILMGKDKVSGPSESHRQSGGYIFDFDGDGPGRRGHKRQKRH